MDRYSTMNDSSSFSSSSDGLIFILEESSDDAPILDYILANKTVVKILDLVMKLRQANQEQSALSSSRRPWNNKRFIRRDWQDAHKHLYKDFLPKTPSTMKPIFSVDFKCENTCSFAFLMPYRVVLSFAGWGMMLSGGVGCHHSLDVPQAYKC